jgi:hypothetical protein
VVSIFGAHPSYIVSLRFPEVETKIASGALISNQLFCHGKASVMLTPENGRLSGVSKTRSARSHPKVLADFSVSFLGEARKPQGSFCWKSRR